MKKVFSVCLVALVCMMQPETSSAQGFLKNLGNAIKSSVESSTSSSDKDAVGNVVNSVVSSTTSNSTTGNIISNIISTVTGSVTTTQSNLVGTWSYKAPKIQFESENALNNIGGDVVAEKVEAKLAPLYKLVGIKEGTLTFTFDDNGKVTYGIGAKKLTASYVFDNKAKTVTIKVSGKDIKTFCTISGNNMALTLDASMLLDLFKGVANKVDSLKTVAKLAEGYTGMKVGFEFSKK